MAKDNVSPLIGIIGPSTSSTTIIVQNLLKSFQIPQIGYSATSSQLTKRLIYNYFLRMVPNDSHQVYVMLRLMKMFKWSYVSVAYTDSKNFKYKGFITPFSKVNMNLCNSLYR